VRGAGAVLENKSWYADGTPAMVDVTTGADRIDRRYSPKGALIAEAHYRDGTPSGTWRTWYRNGAKRTSMKYRADGSPGPLTVWQRSGKKVATANLAARTWSDGAHRGTRVVSVRVADDDEDRIGINGLQDCRATDKKCVRTLVDSVFSPLGCLYPTPDDPLAVWRGRISVTVGFDHTGFAGVTAVHDGDGLPQPVLDCMTGFGAPVRAFQQHVDIVLDVDTLTEPSPPPPLRPMPSLDTGGDPLF